MGIKHTHADIIKAWADGADIECRYTPNGQWSTSNMPPTWDEAYEYRVKHIPKVTIVSAHLQFRYLTDCGHVYGETLAVVSGQPNNVIAKFVDGKLDSIDVI